jgi:hypothetical protein
MNDGSIILPRPQVKAVNKTAFYALIKRSRPGLTAYDSSYGKPLSAGKEES